MKLQRIKLLFPPVHIEVAPEAVIVGSNTTVTVCTFELTVPQPVPVQVLTARYHWVEVNAPVL